MKKIILTFFLLSCFKSYSDSDSVYSQYPPLVIAKQVLYEQDLKNTLKESFTGDNCLINLPAVKKTDTSLTVLKHGTTDVITIGDFKNTNVNIIKMTIVNNPEGATGEGDRTINVYYKRTGLAEHRLNTIDNQACDSTEDRGCYKATCTVKYFFTTPTRADDPTTETNESGCHLLSCCRHCWSITGGW